MLLARLDFYHVKFIVLEYAYDYMYCQWIDHWQVPNTTSATSRRLNNVRCKISTNSLNHSLQSFVEQVSLHPLNQRRGVFMLPEPMPF
jgi:hypothetical protein